MRAARLASRIYWDLGFIMQCSVCGLLVPVYTDDIPIRGCPVAHYPVLEEHAYEPGWSYYCRGGHLPSHAPERIDRARSYEEATAR